MRERRERGEKRAREGREKGGRKNADFPKMKFQKTRFLPFFWFFVSACKTSCYGLFSNVWSRMPKKCPENT
jgi:hypothetical protein